jgi:hypothetical protein
VKKTYASLYAQVIYVICSGVPLMFFPNPLITLLGFEPTKEVWIRILGLLLALLSVYYYRMAKYGNDETIKATVFGRIIFCTGIGLFVLLDWGKPMLLLFAFMEALFAIWTWQEVKKTGFR